jgi:hypothetical protein
VLICMLNNVLDASRNVLLSQNLGAFYLHGRCVCLGLIQRSHTRHIFLQVLK